MPLTDDELNAMRTKILDLEKLVGDLGRQMRENPDSVKLGTALAAAKDEITKLNLRIEAMEKFTPARRKDHDHEPVEELDFA